MPEIVSNLVQVHPFRLRDGIVEHLLLHRAPGEVIHPGIWQVITGGIDPGECSLDAARRELLEETGLAASRWLPLPGVASFYFAPADQVVLSPVFACELDGTAAPVLSAEHADFCWLPSAGAIGRLVFPSHRDGVRQVEEEIERLRTM